MIADKTFSGRARQILLREPWCVQYLSYLRPLGVSGEVIGKVNGFAMEADHEPVKFRSRAGENIL